MMIQKSNPLRSERHRRLVASLPCASCKIEGQSQSAHSNFGKGMGIKACDSQTFPLCPRCHHLLDQSGAMRKEIRRAFEKRLVDDTRFEMQMQKTWADDVEAAYQRVNSKEST